MLHSADGRETASETSALLNSSSVKADTDVPVPSFFAEVLGLLSSGIPVSLGYLLQNSLQLCSIVIIGRLGAMELSIAASGYMIATSTAWLIGIGGTTALDTMGSVAFTSDHCNNNRHVIGIHLQQCLITTLALYIPVVVLWWYSGPLLVLFGQGTALAYGTQDFLRWLSPFGIGYIWFEALKKFLQCQHIRLPGMGILLIVAFVNIPVSIAVVHKTSYGIHGGVVATGSMYCLALLCCSLYICFINGSQAWGGWSRKCFVGLGEFFRLVLLGILMVGAEWWAFEVIAVAAGTMGPINMAAQSIVMTVDTVFALMPFGIGVATTNRVGNLIGTRNFRQGKVVARAASFVAIANGFLAMLIIFLGRSRIAQLFTDNPEVVKLAVTVFPWGAAFQISDGMQAVNSGSLRALGRVDVGAAANFVAYYQLLVLALPIGLGLAFLANFGLHGLWAGLAIALTLVAVFEFTLVNCVSWKKFTKFQDS